MPPVKKQINHMSQQSKLVDGNFQSMEGEIPQKVPKWNPDNSSHIMGPLAGNNAYVAASYCINWNVWHILNS